MAKKPIKKPIVVGSVAPLRKAVAGLRGKSRKVALIPTMGALHDGHFSLIKQARRQVEIVVVSIFVNPAQFAPAEDFASYPRDIKRDIGALTDLGVDLVWAPTEKVMYPDGFSTAVMPGGPAKAGLEDTFRPHFFGGVTTVVSKLFLQVAPDVALFGQKDYQQLKVVTRMAKDLDIPVTVVGVPTLRDKDGLAMSSRNIYLSADERAIAPTLHRVLKDSAAKIRAGKRIVDVIATGRAIIERAGFVIDYLEARHADSLAPIVNASDGPIRLLVAAKLGKTRLIDNIGV